MDKLAGEFQSEIGRGDAIVGSDELSRVTGFQRSADVRHAVPPAQGERGPRSLSKGRGDADAGRRAAGTHQLRVGRMKRFDARTVRYTVIN